MIDWVEKRDGRVVPFNAEKIADAIFAAAKAVGGEDRRQAEFLAGQVIHLLSQSVLAGGIPQVEYIQDLVEKVLIEYGHARTAKAYILYRNRRTRIREQKSELMDVVSEVLQESGDLTAHSTAPLTKLRRIALAASEQYTLNNLLPREFAAAHRRAALHIEHLAHYSLAVTAAYIQPELLLSQGIRQNHLRLPPAKSPEQLARMVGQLTLLAKDELCGELLFHNLDQAFAAVAPPELSVSNLLPALKQLLVDLDLLVNQGDPGSLRISISVGLDKTPAGRCFVQALLQAVEEGLGQGFPALSPQIIYQIDADERDSATSPELKHARAVAKLRGNPSFIVQTDDQPPTFASGLRLPSGQPGLVARSFVNLPRIALEAASVADLWTGIDSALSLVARQLVHRHEVLSALPSQDLPLLMGNSLWAEDEAQDVREALQAGQLAVIPVGIAEALQVARLRFGREIQLGDGEMLQLLQGILQHWREHYALPLELSQTARQKAARRFLVHDQQLFPLARSLWPDRSAYGQDESYTGFSGGQFQLVDNLTDLSPMGVLLAPNFSERRCPVCGKIVGDDVCASGCSEAPITIQNSEGYLQLW